MKIIYDNKTVEKQCKTKKGANKLFKDALLTEKLHSLINFLENASNLNDVAAMPIYRLHPLSGNRKGEFALDVAKKLCKYRLIIKPLTEDEEEVDSSALSNLSELYKSTKIIIVLEVSEHYDK